MDGPRMVGGCPHVPSGRHRHGPNCCALARPDIESSVSSIAICVAVLLTMCFLIRVLLLMDGDDSGLLLKRLQWFASGIWLEFSWTGKWLFLNTWDIGEGQANLKDVGASESGATLRATSGACTCQPPSNLGGSSLRHL